MSSKVKASRKSNTQSENTAGDKRSSSAVIENDAPKKLRVSTGPFVQNECQNIECNSHKRFNIAESDSRLIKKSHDKRKPFYRCIACTFASISYDLMIVHCQHHIIDEAPVEIRITPITTIQTKVLGVKVDVDTDTYKEYKDNSDMNSHKFIDCDYKLLKSDKWPGIFDTMMKHEIDRINCTSVYYFTRIIRLTSEKKASTAPFMLFKCAKCMKCIDPHSIVAHVQDNSCSELLKGFSCYECGRRFVNEISMYLHYKTHRAADASMKYTTISFNYDHDVQVNAVLLKAAGINMQFEPKEKNNALQLITGSGQSPNGVNNIVQQGPGKGEPQANKTVQQAPSIVQSQDSQVGVKKSETITHTMIIKGKNKTNESSEMAHNISKDKVAVIYKCQCEVCFHTLEDLFKHLECCTSEVILKRKTCLCSLVFDEQHYEYHSNLHSQGFTKFHVKKVTVCDEKVIALNMPHEFKGNCETIENNTNKDIATGKTNGITGKASKKDQVIDIEKTTINEIHRKAIAQLIKTILNLSSMVTLGNDPKKFVKKQQQTTATTSRAVDPKSDDSTDHPVSVDMAATQIVQEANKEVGSTKQDEPGKTDSVAQTENNIDIFEAVGTNQPITDASLDNGNLHSQNNTIYSDSGNHTEENQFMVDTTIEVELTAKNNTCRTNHEEHNKILNLEEIQGTHNINSNQETEAIHAKSKKTNECEERIEETTNENVVRDVECNMSYKANATEVKEVAAESKIYTEDELLNEDTSMYFDANSSLNDDEDPILLYDDDDEC